MDLLHITGREGVSVPLGSLAKVTPGTGPLTVNHSDLLLKQFDFGRGEGEVAINAVVDLGPMIEL
jgi:hypothetical protein